MQTRTQKNREELSIAPAGSEKTIGSAADSHVFITLPPQTVIAQASSGHGKIRRKSPGRL